MKPHFGLKETFGPRSHSILQRLDNATSLIVCLKDPVFQVTKRFPVVWILLSVDPVTRVPRLVTGKWSQETGQENGGVRQGKEDGQKKSQSNAGGQRRTHRGPRVITSDGHWGPDPPLPRSSVQAASAKDQLPVCKPSRCCSLRRTPGKGARVPSIPEGPELTRPQGYQRRLLRGASPEGPSQRPTARMQPKVVF